MSQDVGLYFGLSNTVAELVLLRIGSSNSQLLYVEVVYVTVTKVDQGC